MAVDFSLACSFFVFALYVYFSLFRLDVVHTPHAFLIPGVSVYCGIESIYVAPSHRYPSIPALPLLVFPPGFQIVVCSSWNGAGW